MQFKRILDGNSTEFKQAMEIYNYSFPLFEKRALHDQIEALNDEKYHFEVIQNDNSEIIGLLLTWQTEDFIYIEHFAILQSARGQNLGSKVLEKLKAAKNIPIILEIDPAVDEISIRRKNFYERLGFVMTKFAYTQLAYKENDEKCTLNVLSYPMIDDKLYNIYYEFLVNKVFYYSFSRKG